MPHTPRRRASAVISAAVTAAAVLAISAAVAALTTALPAGGAPATAPPASKPAPAPAYGYRLPEGPLGPLWWAEGAYKVMREDPLPATPSPGVFLSAAGGEFEPFLLVLRPPARVDDVRVVASDLAGPGGAVLPAAAVSVKHVEYVRVTQPTDAGGRAGWWPDPLPPVDGPFAAAGGENHPLWITVRVPAGAAPGEYRGSILLSAGDRRQSVPLTLKVRSFSLPDRPSIRSSFGLPTGHINLYHNLETREELEQVMDLYYQNLRDHRLAPTHPFELTPIQVELTGLPWKGGEFDAADPHAGGRSLKIVDEDVTAAIEASAAAAIPVEPGVAHRMSLWTRSAAEGQEATVLLEALDAAGRSLPALSFLKIIKTGPAWKSDAFDVGAFPAEAASVRLRLFPAFRKSGGTTTGTVWFDDIVLTAAGKGANLVPGGDFEMPLESIGVKVDFSLFDKQARRVLDELGFNAFNLGLEGMGTGSFYSRREGVFGGFPQGTPEYDRLFSQYLRQIESHLEARGWLGREYIYWFDEPEPKDYPFVREGMQRIRRNAPRLTRFITEHMPGPEIMDVSEIGCTVFERVDPKMVAELAPRGRELWSYLCTGPKSPWITLFIDHAAVNLRMWLWASYQWGMKGILVWRANYWTSSNLFSESEPQNPWRDPMSYVIGYGIPEGRPDPWGNGDGRFLYPPNRDPGRDKTKYLCGPIDSIRWEILREGIEDYEYFVRLEKAVREAAPDRAGRAAEAAKLLEIPAGIFTDGTTYTKDPKLLLEHRAKVAAAIEELTAGR